MSNRLRLRHEDSAPAERCSFCGRRAGARALRMRGGQLACPRCQESGSLRKLACGHYALAGSLIINSNGDGQTYECAQCSPDVQSFGLARLGLRR